MDNLKGLLFLEGNLRRNFTYFIKGLTATKISELKIADNSKSLLDNGLSVVPEDTEERAKRPRSSSSHRCKVPKHRRNNNEGEEGDLRDKIDCDRVRGRR